MLIRIGYDIALSLTAPTLLLHLLRVHPSRANNLIAPEVVSIAPNLDSHDYTDIFGNRCGRVVVPAGVSEVNFTLDTVIADSGKPDVLNLGATQHPPQDLPFETLQFLLPSRYCEVDSELMQMAWQRFASFEGGSRVQAICDFVHQHIQFNYQSARANRTAVEAYREQVGVCRDFAHLAITLCRCMNIPARYVTGYLGDIGVPAMPSPMDFSAWFEVFLDNQWHTFDARHNQPRVGRVVMARGRDAGDVPITMTFGQHHLVRFHVITEDVTHQYAPAPLIN
jgi:transglutaminase-like putative cysteine protease